MASTRLDIDSNKKSALMKETMRGVAKLLAESPPKEHAARVRTEALIRDDNMLMAYEILKTECQILTERVSTIANCTECPPHLVSFVSDIIFAAPQLNIKELSTARKQFRKKFGKSFKLRAMTNQGGVLNEKLVRYLSSFEPLTQQIISLYMEKICKQYDVDWTPTIEVAFEDIIVLEPAVTGLAEAQQYQDIVYEESSNGTITRSNQPQEVYDNSSNCVVMPMPFAPGYNKKNTSNNNGSDTSSCTSFSSKPNDDDNNDDGYPSAPPPCDGGPVAIATAF